MGTTKPKVTEYRRKSDGFRTKLTAEQVAESMDPADWEPYADYVKGQLAPGPRLPQLDHDGNGEPGGSLPRGKRAKPGEE